MSANTINDFLTIQPTAATSPNNTHAALVVSQESFSGHVVFGGEIRTDEQLRIGSAPNPWETGWLVWNYTDNDHFYYFTLKTNGWELGKRDPSYEGGQRFLATGSNVSAHLGSWDTFRIEQAEATIRVYVNDALIVSFTDTERPYQSGSIGLYTEDAKVSLANVTGSLTDNFSKHEIGKLSDGSAIGEDWNVVFLGYGSATIAQNLPTNISANQVIYGTSGDDHLVGLNGNDLIYGAAGADTIDGGAGNNTIVGGDGSQDGSDLITTREGNDLIFGNGGADTIYSGDGADTVVGGFDADWIVAGAGNDLIYGNQGNDYISSGAGDDYVIAGKGNDTIDAGSGNDTLSGGTGADVFLIHGNSGADVILDFNFAEGDRLAIFDQSYSVSALSNGSALVSLSGGGTIVLSGVAATSVQGQFFI